MAEEQQATTSQAEETGQVQETTEATEEQTEETGQEPEQSEEQFSRDYVEKLRKEAAGYRTKLKEYEDRDKTEAQKAAEERDALKQENEKLRQSTRRSAFVENVGLPSPRLAWSALSDAGVEIEYDDNDRPTAESLEAARKTLKQYDPAVFGDGSVNGGDRGAEPQMNDMNAQLRRAAGRV